MCDFEQNLDGQVAPQVGVSAFEHDAHSAAGDLTEKLDAITPVFLLRHLARRCVHESRLWARRRRIGKEDLGDRADGGGK